MSIVLDGTLGVSLVQDGTITESKISTGAVTDTKLTLTANSQEIKDALNASGSAPIYACRAWVNFNGTGTVAIRASGNVSSITDNGVGKYTVNLTTAMSDANYSVATSNAKGDIAVDDAIQGSCRSFIVSSSQVKLGSITTDGLNFIDTPTISVAIFR